MLMVPETKVSSRNAWDEEDCVLGGLGLGFHNDSNSAVVSDLGGFERHTKGIGMKLLEKMGYRKGGGLGKNRQGIDAPILPKLRPKYMGVGFDEYNVIMRNQNVKEKCQSKVSKGKKKELLRKQKPVEDGVIVQKVIDMRGPQVRVFTNLENLKNWENKVREKGISTVHELQHNVRLVVVDSAELDMQKIDGDLTTERQTDVALQDELNKLEIEADQQLRRLKIISAIDQIASGSSSNKVSLESLANYFHDIHKKHPGDFKLFNFSGIVCSQALPLFIHMFQGWDPLQNPSYGIDTVSAWKELFQSQQDVSSTYTQLVMEVVLPAVRISGTNTWGARYPDAMIRFIEMWERLLPPLALRTILNEIVFPKLSFAVDQWDPCSEIVPIHCWIHPWLPLLSPKLETLFDTIRQKMGNVLLAWHPSDGSALTLLSPWKTVFDAASWENLMVHYIVPKLQGAMREFVIYPADQKLHQFDWVISWASIIPMHHMDTMLEVLFFSKWHQVLYESLSHNPNFEEIMQWYKDWKARLPAEFLANERIRYQLNIGLDMMNQAVEGLTVVQPGLRENMSYIRMREKRKFEDLKKFANVVEGFCQMGNASRLYEMSLKEVVEAYAQQNELLFMLKPRRMHNGHQIYGFGSVNIIIDSPNERLFAQTDDVWSLVHLEQLLEMHKRAISKGR